jgi:hypothetical protein
MDTRVPGLKISLAGRPPKLCHSKKDHITDSVSSDIAEPNTLKCNELEPAAITVVDNVAVVYCYLPEHWADKSGEREPRRTLK